MVETPEIKCFKVEESPNSQLPWSLPKTNIYQRFKLEILLSRLPCKHPNNQGRKESRLTAATNTQKTHLTLPKNKHLLEIQTGNLAESVTLQAP